MTWLRRALWQHGSAERTLAHGRNGCPPCDPIRQNRGRWMTTRATGYLRIAYFAGIAIVMLLVAILLLFWREWLEALVALLISALALGFTLYHHRED